jgi:hypothetical protein
MDDNSRCSVASYALLNETKSSSEAEAAGASPLFLFLSAADEGVVLDSCTCSTSTDWFAATLLLPICFRLSCRNSLVGMSCWLSLTRTVRKYARKKKDAYLTVADRGW